GLVEHVPLAAAADERRRESLAQQLAVLHPEHPHDLAGVDGLARAGVDALGPQRLDELDQPGRDLGGHDRTDSRSSWARAFSMSSVCFRTTPRLSETTSSSSASAPSATSVRAQSRVSETEGAFRNGMARSALTTRMSESARAVSSPGTL